MVLCLMKLKRPCQIKSSVSIILNHFVFRYILLWHSGELFDQLSKSCYTFNKMGLMGSYLYFILDAFVYSFNFVNHSISQPIDGKLTKLCLTGRIKKIYK